MPQTSKRAKRLRRLKREASKLRQTVKILPGIMQQQLNKAYGELLPLVYALLAQHNDTVLVSHQVMEDIRANGPKMKYTVEPDTSDETVTVIRLIRPALTITTIPTDETSMVEVGTGDQSWHGGSISPGDLTLHEEFHQVIEADPLV